MACWEASGSRSWSRLSRRDQNVLFVYRFQLSLPGLGLTAGDFRAGALAGVTVCVFPPAPVVEGTTDWIIANTLCSFCLGDPALVLFRSILVVVVVFVFLSLS